MFPQVDYCWSQNSFVVMCFELMLTWINICRFTLRCTYSCRFRIIVAVFVFPLSGLVSVSIEMPFGIRFSEFLLWVNSCPFVITRIVFWIEFSNWILAKIFPSFFTMPKRASRASRFALRAPPNKNLGPFPKVCWDFAQKVAENGGFWRLVYVRSNIRRYWLILTNIGLMIAHEQKLTKRSSKLIKRRKPWKRQNVPKIGAKSHQNSWKLTEISEISSKSWKLTEISRFCQKHRISPFTFDSRFMVFPDISRNLRNLPKIVILAKIEPQKS